MWRELLGLEKRPNHLVEWIVPRRSFADVVLPDETYRQLLEALTQIQKRQLIFREWGFGERHPTGKGLAFNFAGPPGTGKTICAEAVAHALGRKLLRVRYSELESCWAGETGKNIRTVFREARAQDVVLFFDEADSIACRRFSNVQMGYEREANQAVNILLKELEEYEGVVIFATNMAVAFDPAFERRIHTHILFRIPGVAERERIWRLQIHPDKTPLGPDVNFRELAQRYEVPGGDIRNAVLKAAQIAAAEEGPDERKRLCQRHFIEGMEQVLAARSVLRQNSVDSCPPPAAWQDALEAVHERLVTLDGDLHACRTELEQLSAAQDALASDLAEHAVARQALHDRLERLAAGADALREEVSRAACEQAAALEALRQELEARFREIHGWLEEQTQRLARATLLPWPRAVTWTAASVLTLLCLLAGLITGHFLR